MLAFSLITALLVALIAVWRLGPERAVVGVVLPVMMLWPYGTGWKFKGVELDIMDAVVLPVAVALAFKYARRWRYSLADLLVFFYCFSTLLSNWNADGQSAGLALGTAMAFSCFPPYIIGRVAVERPGFRVALVKRFAFLAFVISLLSLYEYRMERNFFRIWSDKIFHNTSHLILQLRWGYGRIAGPYGHAILAGCILLSALLFAIWLASEGLWGRKFRNLEFLPGRKSMYIVLGLMAGVWMTQSRGPWLSGAFGILLILAARARNQKRALRRVIIASVLLMTVFYAVLNRYTNINHSPSNIDQENAQYRRMLIVNYTPIVKRGGMLGYGLHFPTVDGQVSIDNEYLNLALTQGYLGLGIFSLLILITGARLVRTIVTSRDRTETSFALCLLAVFVTIVLSITTVYLGFQTFTLFFLITGWAQELQPARALAPASEPAVVYSPARFAFRRVWS
ncbi:MAG: O-antigen ligase family protein [Acidobacteriaceae bacterium]